MQAEPMVRVVGAECDSHGQVTSAYFRPEGYLEFPFTVTANRAREMAQKRCLWCRGQVRIATEPVEREEDAKGEAILRRLEAALKEAE